MMGSPYVFDYRATHTIAMRRDEVWRLLQRTERYEVWWPWMRDLKVVGDGLAPGSELGFAIAGPLPHRMRVVVSVAAVSDRDSIGAEVAGDLRGSGRLELADGPNGTDVTLAWTLEVTGRPMRFLARTARPLVRWAHDWAIDAALKGFRKRVREETAGGPEREM